jgi:hypothetical protein
VEVDFDSLCAEREALRSYLLVHASSLRSFEEEGHPWFRREGQQDEPSADNRPVRHLTTTASCLQSLKDVPLYLVDSPPPPCPRNPEELGRWLERKSEGFIRGLLGSKDPEIWKTEEEKLVYTQVRTLPVILQLAHDKLIKEFGRRLKELAEGAWELVDVGDPLAQGVGEAQRGEKDRYPSNAFHTYWAIRLLHEYRARKLPNLSKDVVQKEAVAQLWSRRMLATQTALISTERGSVDAQQLAWALSTDVLCRPAGADQPTTADHHQHAELYEAALGAFFEEQDGGYWRLYEPLFHYKRAGNAYCYAYETLAELLRLALNRRHGRVLRDRLRPYASNLVDAWHYARKTALELEGEAGSRGWCSGHHPHRTKPEAWATASVFSYLQTLRRLLGHWAAEQAKLSLGVRPAGGSSPAAGTKVLKERGETWNRYPTQTVGRQLSMLFLNPIKACEQRPVDIDPDAPLVAESRSALLFGPPGTGKTTLVKGLASALNWDYVEVLASDFLSEGMDQVPKSADAIFKKLMELDHCVILFDEIDELIRARDGVSSDPFGRFLTTSMLPKLAKLWDQRRVLFFVNTNDIAVADPAIKRSQRFDAAMFVPPPSFEKKKKLLDELLPFKIRLRRKDIEKALAGETLTRASLGVFALLRWDQIDDLAHRILRATASGMKPNQALLDALDELGEELERTDWKRSSTPPANAGSGSLEDSTQEGHSHEQMFQRWRNQHLDERRDFRNGAVLRLSRSLGRLPKGWEQYGADDEEARYVLLDSRIEGALEMSSSGILRLKGSSWVAVDPSGTFSFGEG